MIGSRHSEWLVVLTFATWQLAVYWLLSIASVCEWKTDNSHLYFVCVRVCECMCVCVSVCLCVYVFVVNWRKSQFVWTDDLTLKKRLFQMYLYRIQNRRRSRNRKYKNNTSDHYHFYIVIFELGNVKSSWLVVHGALTGLWKFKCSDNTASVCQI